MKHTRLATPAYGRPRLHLFQRPPERPAVFQIRSGRAGERPKPVACPAVPSGPRDPVPLISQPTPRGKPRVVLRLLESPHSIALGQLVPHRLPASKPDPRESVSRPRAPDGRLLVLNALSTHRCKPGARPQIVGWLRTCTRQNQVVTERPPHEYRTNRKDSSIGPRSSPQNVKHDHKPNPTTNRSEPQFKLRTISSRCRDVEQSDGFISSEQSIRHPRAPGSKDFGLRSLLPRPPRQRGERIVPRLATVSLRVSRTLNSVPGVSR